MQTHSSTRHMAPIFTALLASYQPVTRVYIVNAWLNNEPVKTDIVKATSPEAALWDVLLKHDADEAEVLEASGKRVHYWTATENEAA